MFEQLSLVRNINIHIFVTLLYLSINKCQFYFVTLLNARHIRNYIVVKRQTIFLICLPFDIFF
jgi:hypothetical protein